MINAINYGPDTETIEAKLRRLVADQQTELARKDSRIAALESVGKTMQARNDRLVEELHHADGEVRRLQKRVVDAHNDNALLSEDNERLRRQVQELSSARLLKAMSHDEAEGYPEESPLRRNQ